MAAGSEPEFVRFVVIYARLLTYHNVCHLGQQTFDGLHNTLFREGCRVDGRNRLCYYAKHVLVEWYQIHRRGGKSQKMVE